MSKLTKSVSINQLSELPGVAGTVLKENPKARVFAFRGPMGSGKTTFIKILCEKLGVEDKTGSPTYALVNEYQGRAGVKLFHFDFYRIKNQQEVLDIGFEEYLDSGAYCFIEWAENVSSFLPDDYIEIILSMKEGERIISFPIST